MRRTKVSPRRHERLFVALCAVATALPLLVLGALLTSVIATAWGHLDASFLFGHTSPDPAEAGVLPAIAGSAALVLIAAALALPVGVGAAVYLEEYAARGRLARWLELNIANLAGVPSVVYGLLGLEIFVRTLSMGRSLLAGSCTLALLVLPIIVLAAREAVRAVPPALREAGRALGGTRFSVVWRVILPTATPGILTGSILAVARAIGEAAPLLLVGAAVYVSFVPSDLASPYTALPVQIFHWTLRAQDEFAANAAAAILVLLTLLIALNATAIVVRERVSRRRTG